MIKGINCLRIIILTGAFFAVPSVFGDTIKEEIKQVMPETSLYGEVYSYQDDAFLYAEKVSEWNRLIDSLSDGHIEEFSSGDDLLSQVSITTEAPCTVLCKVDGGELESYPDGMLCEVDGPRGCYTFYYESVAAAERAIHFYQDQEGIIYAEIDGEVEVIDPYFTSGQAARSVIGRKKEIGPSSVSFHSWGAVRMHFAEYRSYLSAWGHGQSVVAVIDSGMYRHPMLDSKLYALGYDYVDNDSDPTNDLSGHGTHVAGIIADCTIGLPVYIYPIRVLNAAGGGKISNCVNAIYEACSREVDVINLSMSTTTASDALDQAIRDAVNEGITIVAAAGNQNRDTQTIYPAHLQDEGVIVVGSVEPIAGDESGICRKASYSNYGKSVDVYTFGTNIEGCSITGDYVTKSGTSQAAPHVSSLCAMLYLLHPEELPWQMEHRIMAGTVSQEGMRIVETLNMIPQEEGFFLEQIQLLQGENVCFPSYAYPLTCLEKINYESMDPSVVKVEDNSIKGLAQGSTTVRATCLGLPEKMFTVYVQEKMVDVLEESDPPQIVLPKGLKQIREHAFDQCPSLRFITLPASLEQIEDNNFSGAIVICGYGSKAEQYCKDRNIPYLCNDT